jgi:hypothetical protein
MFAEYEVPYLPAAVDAVVGAFHKAQEINSRSIEMIIN